MQVYMSTRQSRRYTAQRVCVPPFLRSWTVPCENGSDYQCLTQEQYFISSLFGPEPACPSVPTTPSPATTCGLHNNTCSFVEGDPICVSWLHNCDYQYSCTTQEEFAAETATDDVPCSFPAAPPPSPDSICLPVNGTCEWRKPCRVWQNWCGGSYVCGNEAQYAAFIRGPQPICVSPAPNATQPVPAGECVYQNGLCEWSGETGVL